MKTKKFYQSLADSTMQSNEDKAANLGIPLDAETRRAILVDSVLDQLDLIKSTLDLDNSRKAMGAHEERQALSLLLVDLQMDVYRLQSAINASRVI